MISSRKLWSSIFAAALLWFGGAPARLLAQGEREGMFVTVPNPLPNNAISEIEERIKKRDAKSPISTVVFDFNPKGLPAATSLPGLSNDLANLIDALNRGVITSQPIKTVAFIRNEVSRHTVLPVIACRQRIMSSERDSTGRYRARIGNVRGTEEKGPATYIEDYVKRAQAFPSPSLILKMLDPTLVVKKVDTKDGVRYLTDAEIKERRARGETPVENPKIPSSLDVGNTSFDAEQASALGLCDELYNTRAELARALGLPRHSLNEDWNGARANVVWFIEVRGTLDQAKYESIERRIDAAVKRNANMIVLALDSEGGETAPAMSTAHKLSGLMDITGTFPVRTVAYVPPERKLGAATFLALGCNEIVMAKDSWLGDFDYLKDQKEDQLQPKRDMLVKLAEEQGYPPLLFQAMLDRNLEIYSVRSRSNPALMQFISEKELVQDKASPTPKWIEPVRIIKSKGDTFLKLDAAQARQWRVVRYNDVADKSALFNLYGIDSNQIDVARDDFLDRIAEFFRQPVVNVVLVLLGIIGLILELKMPGFGLPGIMAAICFVLFFWAHSFVGEFTMLAVLLFVLGLILIGVEVFLLPGLGVTGISGILLVVGSLVLVTMEKMPSTSQEWTSLGMTLTTFAATLVGAIIAAFTLGYYLPHIPYANRLMLAPPGEGEGDQDSSAADDTESKAALLGAIGVAATTLRPAGKAQFGDDFLDVIAEGDYVNTGARVQVIEIEGNRIVVKEV